MFAVKIGFGRAAASQRQYAHRMLNRNLHSAKFHNPPQAYLSYPRAARFKSTAPAVPKSGHIEEGPNESLLFIDSTCFTIDDCYLYPD